jgi:uncharacterized membrane protein YidH (DUF202 family)
MIRRSNDESDFRLPLPGERILIAWQRSCFGWLAAAAAPLQFGRKAQELQQISSPPLGIATTVGIEHMLSRWCRIDRVIQCIERLPRDRTLPSRRPGSWVSALVAALFRRREPSQSANFGPAFAPRVDLHRRMHTLWADGKRWLPRDYGETPSLPDLRVGIGLIGVTADRAFGTGCPSLGGYITSDRRENACHG